MKDDTLSQMLSTGSFVCRTKEKTTFSLERRQEFVLSTKQNSINMSPWWAMDSLQCRCCCSPSQDWKTFLKNHANEAWACYFLLVIDLLFRRIFVFFIGLGSLRVVHSGVTRHPMDAWVAQQLREATPYGAAPRFLIRDNDSKFGQDFALVAKSTNIEGLRTPYRAPRANAVCERFLGRVRRECLDHRLMMSERRFYRLIREYVEYFNQARPHQGLGQRIPEGPRSVESKRQPGKIISFPVLGGLHHDYRRAA